MLVLRMYTLSYTKDVLRNLVTVMFCIILDGLKEQKRSKKPHHQFNARSPVGKPPWLLPKIMNNRYEPPWEPAAF